MRFELTIFGLQDRRLTAWPRGRVFQPGIEPGLSRPQREVITIIPLRLTPQRGSEPPVSRVTGEDTYHYTIATSLQETGG